MAASAYINKSNWVKFFPKEENDLPMQLSTEESTLTFTKCEPRHALNDLIFNFTYHTRGNLNVYEKRFVEPFKHLSWCSLQKS